nr:SIP domain-containing protein [Gordonia desulfuricans]
MKWANRRNFVFDDGPAPIVVIGDATVIGLAMAFRDRIGASGRGFRAILEVPAADVAATAELVPGADVQAVGDTPGAAILTHLAAASFTDGSVFYLAGHGQSIQQQRTVLREVHSVPRKAIRTQPFWATGKVGL